ncbi:CHASE3 domain-containing protein [Bradyrhizobium sp.]|uniref:CHASE3 domain-containing protein n=1 Tax=Bradyrhizobium sp. TaxID=376 RepID=UPI0025BFB02B|nr:CHASE3 domain-containing protein [Bradyrhizobium sp.]
MRALRAAFLSQRLIVGIGLAVLLVISAASIAMDVRSRTDTAWVDHTLDVLNKIADVRLLIRRAESAARGFALTNDENFAREFRETSSAIPETLADLKKAVSDNDDESRLVASTEPLLSRRLAIIAELVRLQAAHDSAGRTALISKAEGRVAMDKLSANLDSLSAEEHRLLAVRSAQSDWSGKVLLTTDLVGVLLILILAMYLIRGAYLSNRALATSLTAARAANESLEAEVVAQEEHIGAVNEVVRHSFSVMENTFNTIAEAVLVVDTRGDILLTNPAAERLLGHRDDMSIADLWKINTFCETDGTTIQPENRPYTLALRGQFLDQREVVVRPHDGRKQVRVSVSGRPLRDAAGKISGACLVVHDITDLHEAERKLQQAQKLEAIGKLTGGVAHDFNNMLTVITGTMEVLMDELQGNPDALQTAALVGQAAERCTELIQHLLAFARKQPLRPRNIDINTAILDIAKLLRPTLGEQIEIDAILEDDVAEAHVDSSQLAHSLVNMAINSRDAMPEGGKLLLETRSVVLDEAYARANPDVTSGPYVMIAVSDSGCGMPPEVCDQAFDPFFTTKGVGKGSGLGLSMVYGFVKQSGGHIKIYSEPGHGTTIRLYLPPASAVEEAQAIAGAPVLRGGEAILVVEDDPIVRDFVMAQLRSLGYRTIAAADSREALSCVQSGAPFDLLFTDVILPGGMSGRQLADETERLRPGTKVLFTSGYTDNAIVHHGRLDEGVVLLSKPYRKSDLARMVRVALGDLSGDVGQQPIAQPPQPDKAQRRA